jgi:DNA mismatch repair ATPase MutS
MSPGIDINAVRIICIGRIILNKHCPGIYTHFKHEEDKSLDKGKFDDELSKMDNIVKHLRAKSMILFNESFSSTNTREGSEIAME